MALNFSVKKRDNFFLEWYNGPNIYKTAWTEQKYTLRKLQCRLILSDAY